jgi:hypothetical protein
VIFLTCFVFFFADEHNDGGGPMYMLQAYAPFKVVAFRYRDQQIGIKDIGLHLTELISVDPSMHF